jgi:hypothetical protein
MNTLSEVSNNTGEGLPARQELYNSMVESIGLVHQVVDGVMKEGVHYGRLPGCGQRKVLLKAGAEKLLATFRLSPTYEVHEKPLEEGHLEYRVGCTLTSILSGEVQGQGLGSCTTMESKYRYRKDRSGSRIEHPDIADQYNTVLKMAKKRALVDAVITVLAVADIFDQDLDDMTTAPGSGSKPGAKAPPAHSKEEEGIREMFKKSVSALYPNLEDHQYTAVLREMMKSIGQRTFLDFWKKELRRSSDQLEQLIRRCHDAVVAQG